MRALLLCSVALLSRATQEDWPSCIVANQAPQASQPFFTDVRGFIKHADDVRHKLITFSSDGNIGMVLRETPHEFGEFVEDVLPGSQAWTSGVRKGWIITAVNGKRFSPAEGLKDLATDFSTAKSSGATVAVKYDVRTAMDCPNSDCRKSDRFPTDASRYCAIACAGISGCEWWSFGPQGADNMCLLYSSVSGFVKLNGIHTGTRGCVPVPEFSESTSWPACASVDADLHFGKALFTDVSAFISRPDDIRHKEVIFTSEGNIGMGLRETPHDLGELVSEILPGSQAFSAGVQKGWIIKEVAGKPFTKTESVLNVASDFTSAKSAGPTVTVKFDVKSSMDCTDGDCTNSDKLPAASKDVCAKACSQITGCASWSFSSEAEDEMCWLRSDVPALRLHAGSFAGTRSCIPPSRTWLWILVVVLLVVGWTKAPTGVQTGLRAMFAKTPDRYSQMMLELGVVSEKEKRACHNQRGDELDSLLEGNPQDGAARFTAMRPWTWLSSFVTTNPLKRAQYAYSTVGQSEMDCDL